MNSVFRNDMGRLGARITLKAFAFETYGEISHHGSQHRVSLVDITPAGARLRLLSADGRTPRVGETFLLNIELPIAGLESGAIPCRTAWVDKQEVGVAFITGLPATVGELQRSIDAAPRYKSA